MREVTYSQGVIVEDATLLSALAVFCQQIWLPDITTPQAVAAALTAEVAASGPWPKGQAWADAIRNDQTIECWDQQYRCLFEAGALRRLPRFQVKHEQHDHRKEFSDRSVDEIFGTSKPLFERLALRYHLLRTDLPGIELFQSGKSQQSVDLAAAVFHLELPKLNCRPDKLLEVREAARKAGVAEFWEMIDEQAAYGEAEEKRALVRAEKIRQDFKKWKDDFFKYRGFLFGSGLMAVLCWYHSAWAPFASIAAAASLGEINRWWLSRDDRQHKGFKFINQLDGTFQELG